MGELLFTIFYGSALIAIGLFTRYMINKYIKESIPREEKVAK